MSDTQVSAVATTDGRLLVLQSDGSYRVAEDRTDWQRVDAQADADIAANAADDPDDPARDTTSGDDFWKHAEPICPPPKARIAIRIDQDILDYFKAKGPGYQTRIHGVLRAFVDAHTD